MPNYSFQRALKYHFRFSDQPLFPELIFGNILTVRKFLSALNLVGAKPLFLCLIVLYLKEKLGKKA